MTLADPLPNGLSFNDLTPQQRDLAYEEFEVSPSPEAVAPWVKTLRNTPPQWNWQDVQDKLDVELAEQAATDHDKKLKALLAQRVMAKEIDQQADEQIQRKKADAAGLRSVRDRLALPSQIVNIEPPPSLIDGVLDGAGVSMLIGTRGVGKTFLALDMALSIATGLQWGAHVTHPAKGRVLYLAGEGGGRAFGIRIEAWATQHGIDAAALDPHVRIVDGSAPFMSSGWDELVEIAAEFDPEFVVVDTLSRHMVGLSENDNSDAQAAVSKAEMLRDRVNAAVMVLHHPPKGTTGGVNAARGATAWEGSVDSVFTLAPYLDDDSLVEMTATKQKHREAGLVGLWRLHSVPVRPAGPWSTSLVPVPADPLTVPSVMAQHATKAAKAAAVETWLIGRVTAEPGMAASRYYRAPGTDRRVVIDGESVPFSRPDAEAALDRLVADGRLRKTNPNPRLTAIWPALSEAV